MLFEGFTAADFSSWMFWGVLPLSEMHARLDSAQLISFAIEEHSTNIGFK